MTDEVITEIGEFALPFGRRANLKDVEFDGGLHMLRITLREGRRFTIVDLDTASAGALAQQMAEWARTQGENA